MYFPSLPLFSQLPSTGNQAFDMAAQIIFHHEGFWSNDPNDPGGPTAWGWSLRAAKELGDLDGDDHLDLDLDFDGDVDVNDIILLKDRPDIALDLYKTVHWDKYRYDLLDPYLAIKLCDLSVNMGASQAHKLLQRSVRACGGQRLIDDGILGKKTFAALSRLEADSLIPALRSHAAGFYQLLACQRPTSRKYLNGWLNRAYF